MGVFATFAGRRSQLVVSRKYRWAVVVNRLSRRWWCWCPTSQPRFESVFGEFFAPSVVGSVTLGWIGRTVARSEQPPLPDAQRSIDRSIFPRSLWRPVVGYARPGRRWIRSSAAPTGTPPPPPNSAPATTIVVFVVVLGTGRLGRQWRRQCLAVTLSQTRQSSMGTTIPCASFDVPPHHPPPPPPPPLLHQPFSTGILESHRIMRCLLWRAPKLRASLLDPLRCLYRHAADATSKATRKFSPIRHRNTPLALFDSTRSFSLCSCDVMHPLPTSTNPHLRRSTPPPSRHYIHPPHFAYTDMIIKNPLRSPLYSVHFVRGFWLSAGVVIGDDGSIYVRTCMDGERPGVGSLLGGSRGARYRPALLYGPVVEWVVAAVSSSPGIGGTAGPAASKGGGKT